MCYRRAGIPALQKRGGGTIVVNGSIAAYKGFPNHPAYCASKDALAPLVKQVALALGHRVSPLKRALKTTATHDRPHPSDAQWPPLALTCHHLGVSWCLVEGHRRPAGCLHSCIKGVFWRPNSRIMAQIRLPDGTVLEVASGSSVADVAAQIGPGLAKAAVAARLDGEPVDLSVVVPEQGQPTLEILTAKSDAALDVLRHSTAHIMAQAVGRLYDNVKFAIGPSIENGFYYDFDLPTRLTDQDLPRIEDQMRSIVKEKLTFERKELPIGDARRLMAEQGQDYKVEMIDDLASGRDGKPQAERVSIYSNGDFLDLCRGPHLPDTSRAGVFKLTHVAGAYWRGDQERPMLQRIYGTAFWDRKQLEEHLARI
ncbi:MAG: SDR family NAD(P)-dependent oxidoreductase, partial [Anaerolineaceae bacterium]|nr:SDR family NAD(P)-dependent oxidoreductase [Anaerolineaceae bacterium]